jgi:alkylresorcinol/alkylpyrone synthase/polyketide synthase Type III
MSEVRPRILSVGCANPPQVYEQAAMPDLFRVKDPRIRSLFQSSHIRTRHLILPPPGPDGPPKETQGELIEKHRTGVVEVGARAIARCLEPEGLAPADIDYLMCITSSGFLCPGVTAILIKELGFREDCSRVDIVGMGCNAALNGLNPVTAWCIANPGKRALMLCIEVNSAAYVFDETLRTAIVNSLFGDGAAAVLLRADSADAGRLAPEILGFNSHIIPQAIGAMRFDWDSQEGKWSFYLDRDIPYVVGAHAERPVRRLLEEFGLKRRDIRHWLVHSGGKKVIDAIKYNIGITEHDVRHTVSVLRDYGNISSASVLFSYQRLLKEGVVRRGDYGVVMTMGPGSTIETALIRWGKR